MAKVIASRWSSRLSVAAPSRRRRAVDREVVAVDLDPGAERARGRRRCRRSGRIPCGAARRRRGSRSCRGPGVAARQRIGISSMAAATSAGPRSIAAELGRADDEVGERLADAVVAGRRRRPTGVLLDVGAHRAQEVDDRPARRVDADVAQRQLGVGMDRAGDQPEGGRRDVARDPLVDRLHRRPSFDRPGHRARRLDPSRSTGTPRARSIRSVWSRVATASRTVVARRPAARPAGSPTSPGRSAPASRSRSAGAGCGRPRSAEGGSRSVGRGAPRPSSAAAR